MAFITPQIIQKCYCLYIAVKRGSEAKNYAITHRSELYLGALLSWCSAETLGRHVSRHANTLPTIVVLLDPGGRGAVIQQLLLGFLQQRTVGIVLLEQLNARLCVSGWIMRVGYKPCKGESQLPMRSTNTSPALNLPRRRSVLASWLSEK